MSKVVSPVLTKGQKVEGGQEIDFRNGNTPALKSKNEITGQCWLLSG